MSSHADPKALTVTAFTATEFGEPLVKQTYEAAPLGAGDVTVKVLACGVCASDADILRGKYGKDMTQAMGYLLPLVAGHEGVGEVTELGATVKHLKVGDRVGLGVYRGACKACDSCATGKDNLCPAKALMFIKGAKGAFADCLRIDAAYAFKVPDGIPTEKAGPLMCAGLTTFAPFKEHNIRPGQRVGVVGLGGLGHLALQFAKAFGCEVSAFSRGTAKKEEVTTFGAHHYVDSGDADAMKGAANSLDYLLLTANGGDADVSKQLALLRPGGKIVCMGLAAPAITVSLMQLIPRQLSVVGSAAGSSATMREMLAFSALHGIAPMTEDFPFDRVNEALARVVKGDLRYRAVLRWDLVKQQ